MRCPNCKEPLLVLEFDGIEVDYCDDCHGVWLDHEEIPLLLGRQGWDAVLQPAAGEPLTRERTKGCPRCNAAMRKRSAGKLVPVTCDLCPRGHGLWLDAGEACQLSRELSPSGPFAPIAGWLSDVLAGNRPA